MSRFYGSLCIDRQLLRRLPVAMHCGCDYTVWFSSLHSCNAYNSVDIKQQETIDNSINEDKLQLIAHTDEMACFAWRCVLTPSRLKATRNVVCLSVCLSVTERRQRSDMHDGWNQITWHDRTGYRTVQPVALLSLVEWRLQ